jgi:hypothetical protein
LPASLNSIRRPRAAGIPHCDLAWETPAAAASLFAAQSKNSDCACKLIHIKTFDPGATTSPAWNAFMKCFCMEIIIDAVFASRQAKMMKKRKAHYFCKEIHTI